jgi:hypothetical protein
VKSSLSLVSRHPAVGESSGQRRSSEYQSAILSTSAIGISGYGSITG